MQFLSRSLVVCLAPTMLFSLASAVPSTAVSLADPISIPAGDSPWGIVIADFDGGSPDIATANLAGESFSFIHNRGDGTFDPAQQVAIGSPARILCTADLNSDTHLDLVASLDIGSPSLVAIAFGDGLGGFSTPVGAGAGAFPTGLVAEDLDADGDPDLAAILAGSPEEGGGQVVVLLNHGDGSFAPETHYTAHASLVYLADLSAGDVDADQDLDLLVTIDLSGVALIMENDGQGAFAPGASLGITGIGIGNALGDVDGDQDLDAAVIDLDERLWVVRNDGAGAFSSPVAVHASVVSNVSSRLLIADLDEDARPEVVLPGQLVNGYQGLGIHANDGGGGFGTFTLFNASPSGRLAVVVPGDLNGDTRVDLVASDRVADLLYVYFGAQTVAVPAAAAAPALDIRAHPLPLGRGESLIVDVQAAEPRAGGQAAALHLVAATGRRVRTLSAPFGERSFTFRWDGRDAAGHSVPPGVYFALVETDHARAHFRVPVVP